MKRTILPLVTFGVLAWSALAAPAQEVIPPPGSAVPEKIPQEKIPVPPPVLPPLAPAEPGCCQGPPAIKILWMERQVPIQVLTPREVVVPEKRPTLAVDFREVKRVVTEIIMKPREVTREVPFTTMKPYTEVCPETGHCTTVLKPCTEIRLVKETVFYPAPEQRTILVRVPYVKEVEEIVPRKTIILEYRTELQRVPAAIGVPVLPEPQLRYLRAPQGCVHPEAAPPQACPAGQACPARPEHP